jgi:GTP-binding protein
LYTSAVSRFPDARFLLSAAAPAHFPPDQGVEVAFAGRSNAGKSSALNAITQRRALARVSKTPGRTRLLNFFEMGTDRRLVDLPGYGYASVSAEKQNSWAPLIESLRERESLRGMVLIVDSRRGVKEEDLAVVRWAHGLDVHVLLSKSDKLNRAEGTQAVRQATAALAGLATVQLFSMSSGVGVQEAQDLLESWLK